MNYSILKSIKIDLPAAIVSTRCVRPTLLFNGKNWCFEAMTAWRISRDGTFLFGSDDFNREDEDRSIELFLKDVEIHRILAQTSRFHVDPTFYLNNSSVIEIFSEVSYDTWTCWLNNESTIDFAVNDNRYIETSQPCFISELSDLLPILIDDITYKNDVLTISGSNMKFICKCPGRFIIDDSLIYPLSESRAIKLQEKIKNCHINSIQAQSPHLKIDPVFSFSNGIKLELFSTSKSEPWIFELSGGKTISGTLP